MRIHKALQCVLARVLGVVMLLLVGVLDFGEGMTTPIAHAAPDVTIRVIITHVDALDCVDEDIFGGCESPPDFYPIVRIDGVEFSTQYIDDTDNIFPNWGFDWQIDLAKGNIPIQIEIHDYDSGSDDDSIDLDIGGDRPLNLMLNLTTCSITGDDSGFCPATLTSSGDGDDRAFIEYRVEVSGKLNPPTNVAASDGTYLDKIRVTWNTAPGATSYEVWRNTVNNPITATRIASSVNGTSYDDTNISRGVTYYYWVKARNPRYLTSDFSTAFVSGYALAAPAGVLASDGLIDRVRVTWQTSLGATSYEVRRHTSNNCNAATVLNPSFNGTSYNDTTAVPGVRYHYWVRAKKSSTITECSAFDQGYRAQRVFLPIITR